MSRRRRIPRKSLQEDVPLWYKDAIVYEVPVRAFRDGNGDGWGDFKGLVETLDYLQDLGVTALWLLPFYPSPLRDDGYDIADYRDVHPRYGTLQDFKVFLREAHRRGLRVISELVINHTSDQHPWFQRARHARPGDPARDFYVWSDTTNRYTEARIIFKDFETSNWTWDPVAKAFYWHRFYSHQPDLNFDNPRVWEAVFDVLDYWLEMGIDGLRLDAIPYLYEREGTNCENLPETHTFLKALRKHVDEKFPNRLLLAEANQWPEDSVAYFGQGDECHMAFHFPVMPRLFMGIRMEDRLPIIDILQQTPPIPPSCQWALFLRNHDELTLEMVTDEDRDYMYRVYARDPQARINLGIRRRLAPLLENHRDKIELMNGLLCSLPGTPVLYYGDEIGMGDNIYLGDRNGVRTPMQWSGERNAGFSRANPQRLYLPVIIDPEYHYEAVNVEVQQNNPHSLLWWTKRLLDLRKRHLAFGRGDITFLTPDNHKVLAFIRSYALSHEPGGSAPALEPSTPGVDNILVVANLSRFTQYVELDLCAFKGWTPVELMGRNAFPAVGDRPYFLTLGPYAFYWFALEQHHVSAGAPEAIPALRPTLEVIEKWEHVFAGDAKVALQEWLPTYLKTCSWFVKRDAQIEAAMLLETIPVPTGVDVVSVGLVQVEYSEGDAETYVLPMAFATGSEASRIQNERPQAVLAMLRILPRPAHRPRGAERGARSAERRAQSAERGAPSAEPGAESAASPALRAPHSALAASEAPREAGILYDPLGEQAFSRALLEAILGRRRFRRSAGELIGVPVSGRRPAPHGDGETLGAASRTAPTAEDVCVPRGRRVGESGEQRASGEELVIVRGSPGTPRALTRTARVTGMLEVDPSLIRSKQRNSSVLYGDRFILKLFRRIEEGINPEVEVGRFLAEKTDFRNVPPLVGMIEYRRGWGQPMTLAVLHQYVPHQSDGWRYSQDVLGRYFEEALTRHARGETPPVPQPPLELIDAEIPPLAYNLIGPTLEGARLLGQRTGEMHLALASRPDDPDFAPESFSTLYQRSLYQSFRSQARQAFVLLRKRLNELPEDVRAEARKLADNEDALLQRIRAVYQHKIHAQRIRCHCDYRLREVLWTGRDFIIIDFEGMPTRPLSDRRRKYTPLRDVAGMLRSFHYAALYALVHGGVRHEDRPTLAPWARFWHTWVAVVFLKAYREVASRGTFLPRSREEEQILLDFYLMKRAVNELRYELGRTPTHPEILIQGLLQSLEASPTRV